MHHDAPKYIFFGFVILVCAGLASLYIIHKEPPPPGPLLNGAGSTFISPLMMQWSAKYEKTEHGCKIGYASLGSGEGVKRLLAKADDFACSDAPLTDEQLAKAREGGGEVVHVPLVLGAVVPAYNLPEVKVPLRFDGPVLADIYLGKIKRWNQDERLRDLNPGVKLPDREIVVVHRSDGSGTTYVWADYLAKVSTDWADYLAKVNHVDRKSGLLARTEFTWPAGLAENGNEGVGRKVRTTPYSIGYVELTFAYQLDLPFGLVRNHDGEDTKANLASIAAAAEGSLKDIPDDLRFSLTDAPGKESYPIVSASWAIVRVPQPAAKREQLADFLSWATTDAQEGVTFLLYCPLPTALAERAATNISLIRDRQ